MRNAVQIVHDVQNRIPSKQIEHLEQGLRALNMG
jgi:hypothetical protein